MIFNIGFKKHQLLELLRDSGPNNRWSISDENLPQGAVLRENDFINVVDKDEENSPVYLKLKLISSVHYVENFYLIKFYVIESVFDLGFNDSII
jgi:hypothetical protein